MNPEPTPARISNFLKSNDLEFRSHYWNDPKARSAFKAFILDIHGLDFTTWEQAGYWDARYQPFSFFKDGEVIANVCIYAMDAIISGSNTTLLQISGVGTSEAYRRNGLSRELTERGIESVAKSREGIFLFADEEAIPYYQKCGFTALQEYLEIFYAIPTDPIRGALKQNISQSVDLDKIFNYASNRAPISEIFSVLNAELFMFHALYFLQDHIYEIPELKCLVCYKRTGNSLDIFDILGEQIPEFDTLYPYIARETDHTVKFHFHTDKMGLKNTEKVLLEEHHAFTRGNFPISNPIFPYTSRA